MRRKIVVFLIIVISYLLQSAVFENLPYISVTPNLLVIVVAAFGFMRGSKEGMWIGLFAGLIVDVFCGTYIGFYALIYMYIGFLNGIFRSRFFPEDIKLPLILIAASEFVYSLSVYIMNFMFQGRSSFGYCFLNIMLPELVFTILISVFVYFIILKINKKLEAIEKRSTSKFA